MLHRRERRGRAPISEDAPGAYAAEIRQAQRQDLVVTPSAVSRAATVARAGAWRRGPSDSFVRGPLPIAAEAARFGVRTRRRRSRTEERRAGVTTTVIEHVATSRSHIEKDVMSREQPGSLAAGSIPGAWETRSPQAIDVSRLTDEVLTQIDRRVVARRERLGRI